MPEPETPGSRGAGASAPTDPTSPQRVATPVAARSSSRSKGRTVPSVPPPALIEPDDAAAPVGTGRPTPDRAENPAAPVFLKQDGQVYAVRDWETVRRWIAERRVDRTDLVSEGGVRWEPVDSHSLLRGAFEENDDVASTPPIVSHVKGDTPFGAPTAEVWTDDDTEGVPTGLPPMPTEGAPSFGELARAGRVSPSEALVANSDTGPSSDRLPSSDTPSSDTPSSDTPSSDTPSSDTPSSDTPSSDTPSSDTPSSDTPSSDSDTGPPSDTGPSPRQPESLEALAFHEAASQEAEAREPDPSPRETPYRPSVEAPVPLVASPALTPRVERFVQVDYVPTEEFLLPDAGSPEDAPSPPPSASPPPAAERPFGADASDQAEFEPDEDTDEQNSDIEVMIVPGGRTPEKGQEGLETEIRQRPRLVVVPRASTPRPAATRAHGVDARGVDAPDPAHVSLTPPPGSPLHSRESVPIHSREADTVRTPERSELPSDFPFDSEWEAELARKPRRWMFGVAVLATLLVSIAFGVWVQGWGERPEAPLPAVVRPAPVVRPSQPASVPVLAEQVPDSEPVPVIPEPDEPRRTAAEYVTEGWALVEKDKLQGAAEQFAKGLEVDGAHHEANYGFGYALLMEGRREEAIGHLCRARNAKSTETRREVAGILKSHDLTCD